MEQSRKIKTAITPQPVTEGAGVPVRRSIATRIVSSRPLNEPIARYGPFVMNTEEEIREILRELREGTFIR